MMQGFATGILVLYALLTRKWKRYTLRYYVNVDDTGWREVTITSNDQPLTSSTSLFGNQVFRHTISTQGLLLTRRRGL